MRRLVIAGTESGVGKTTLSMGLMASFIQQGYRVQGYKCGPDFIDPSFHTAVTGRPSRNLDSWMLSEKVIRQIVSSSSEVADISIIEGVMGMFDGESPESDKGSTAHIAAITQSPVLLVINCAAQGRSAAAVVKGFQTFAKECNIVGVIANRVGSKGHFELVRKAIEQECHIPVVGYLTEKGIAELPERHLGLVPAIETEDVTTYSKKIGEIFQETFDLSLIYELSKAEEISASVFQENPEDPDVTIAVAKDEAFHFYYEENIDLLRHYGARCVYFSPIHDKEVPSCDGVYLGGGFPELFAQKLAKNETMKASLQKTAKKGKPFFAECGGFMYLCDELIDVKGRRHQMAGVINGVTKVHDDLQAIRYVEVKGEERGTPFLEAGDTIKGHEFRYSSWDAEYHPVMGDHVMASYSHLHFASCPNFAKNSVEACRR